MPFTQTPRGRMFYREARGQKPTLIFLHGNLGSSRWWRPVLDHLPDGWRGLAPDAIGCGHSQRSERLERYAVSAQALDLAAFSAELGLGPAHVVAHSTATPAAIEFALAHPERVETLTLVGPVPAGGISTPAEAYPLPERMSADRAMLAQALSAVIPTLDPASELFLALLDEAAGAEPLSFVASARALDAWQPGQRLRQLTLPVLLMRGEHDIMLSSEEAHQTLLAIPGANNLEVFRGVGHSPMLENPRAFADVLVRFIAEEHDEFEAIRQSAEE